MIAAAALLLAAIAPPTAAASADRQLVDAFRVACDRVDDFAKMRAEALAGGWQEVAESSDPRVARLTRAGREALAGDGGRISGATFARTIGERRLFLIQSRWEGEDGIWGNGCRLFHFEATTPIAPDLLQAWMGRPPTGTQQVGNEGSKRLWEPGWRNGMTIEVNHVPAGGAIEQRFGLSGNILVAQAIGGF